MVISKFIDREKELNLLKKQWKKENAFVIVYGRRRIGKTTLIKEFIKNKKGITYFALDTNKEIQIEEFKQKIAAFFNDKFLFKQKFESWNLLFNYLEKVLPKNKKFFIWIDEFTYLIKNDKTILSVLQRFIDNFLRDSKLFLIVSGSLFNLMIEEVLKYTSPLYGRRDLELLLEKIKFPHFIEFFKNKNIENFYFYFSIGGIPEYLKIASNYKDFFDFLNQEFFKKEGYFYKEPLFILSQDFKEIKTYFSIIQAVSFGNTKASEIANFVGIETKKLYPYLEMLINYNILKREENKFEKNKSFYYINDEIFDFWFNFVYKNRDLIEQNLEIKLKTSELNSYFGKRFEIFVRNELIYKILNFKPTLVCKYFTEVNNKEKRKKESIDVDVIAFNEQEKKIAFLECKWQELKIKDVKRIIKELEEKLNYFYQRTKLNRNELKEYLGIVAKEMDKKAKEWLKENGYLVYELKDFDL
jgi:AAA+ ATPase superfamily predicted ATPase